MSKKRALENFFTPASQKEKKFRPSAPTSGEVDPAEVSNHATYPFAFPNLPPSIIEHLNQVPASQGKEITDQPDLDLLYFQPYIPHTTERELFEFLRSTLFYYRVQYTIKRYGTETHINTPRFTTVFGVDTSSKFTSDGDLVDCQTSKSIAHDRDPSSHTSVP